MVTLLECKQSWKNEKNCQKIEWNWKLNRSWNHDHDSNCKKKRPRYTVCVFVLFSLFIHRAGIEEESLNQSWKWSRVNQFPYSIGKENSKLFMKSSIILIVKRRSQTNPFSQDQFLKTIKLGQVSVKSISIVRWRMKSSKVFLKNHFWKAEKVGHVSTIWN